MDICCLKKKKNQSIPPPAQPLLKSPQTKIPELYKIDLLIYSPKPPARQLSSSSIRAIQKKNLQQHSQSVQKTKSEQKEKQKKKIYTQQYPLYPPFVYRQQIRKQNEHKPTQRSYNNLIKRLNFNARNQLNIKKKNKSEPQEEMLMKIPMIRTFSYGQQVIDVSDQYVQHYYRQFQQEQKEKKSQKQIKQREELRKLQFLANEQANKLK